jgi:hypothetical protein
MAISRCWPQRARSPVRRWGQRPILSYSTSHCAPAAQRRWQIAHLDPGRAVDVKQPEGGRELQVSAMPSPTGFLITFCIGIAATLGWQSYGDAAREMIASSYPQLGWVAPQPASAPSDQQQLNAMSLDAVRQSKLQKFANPARRGPMIVRRL